MDLARGRKKAVGHECGGDTNCSWFVWNGPQMFGTKAGRIENQRKNGDLLDYGINKINQNSEKSPGDLMRLAVTQTPVKDHRQTLV